MERGRNGSRGMLPLLAVHALSEFYRLERKPPVTAGLLAANTLIYLRPGLLDAFLPTLDQVWFNPHIILKDPTSKTIFGRGYERDGLYYFGVPSSSRVSSSGSYHEEDDWQW